MSSHSEALIIHHQFALLLLSISSLAKTPFQISPTNILPLLLKTLTSGQTGDETKTLSLSALHNLSTNLSTSKPIAADRDLVHALLASSTNRSASEVSLATLSNLVVSSACKKLVEGDPSVPGVLVEVLAREDSPKCQEMAAYLLMVVAHRSRAVRARMEREGVGRVLVEVALLGTPLARERAGKLLGWLKDEKWGRVAVHSGPQARRAGDELARGECEDEDEVQESRKAVQRMVKQSLDRNMESIMTRAGGGGEGGGAPGLCRVLAAGSRSKSMPY